MILLDPWEHGPLNMVKYKYMPTFTPTRKSISFLDLMVNKLVSTARCDAKDDWWVTPALVPNVRDNQTQNCVKQ